MSDQDADRARAATLPKGDIVRILLSHHAQVRDLLDEVRSKSGPERKRAFELLGTLLKAHETAEESVVRPVTKETAGPEVAEARNDEEAEADKVIAKLKQLDPDSPEFESEFGEFSEAVEQHAEAEENDEFPTLQSGRSQDERIELGEQFLAQFRAAGGTG